MRETRSSGSVEGVVGNHDSLLRLCYLKLAPAPHERLNPALLLDRIFVGKIDSLRVFFFRFLAIR